MESVCVCVCEVQAQKERLGKPLQPTPARAKVANGLAQTHRVDIALGPPTVP